MRNVRPRIAGTVVRVGEDQPQYTPVDVITAVHPLYGVDPACGYNTIIMCFEPSADERQRIIKGENIYVALLTGGEDQEPIILSAGPEDMARWHNLKVAAKPLVFDDNLPGCNAGEQADGCQGVRFEGL